MLKYIMDSYKYINKYKMINEMEGRAEQFTQYQINGSDNFKNAIADIRNQDYNSIKSLYQTDFHRLNAKLPKARQEYLEEQARQRKAEKERLENERRKEVARQKIDLLSNNANIIKEDCSWITKNINFSYSIAVIDRVVGTSTTPVSFASGAALHNTVAGISNAQSAGVRAAIRTLMTQAFVYRPMTSVSEAEKRLMIAMIVFYTLGYIKDAAFHELWFSFVWAGGAKGKVGINRQSKYTGSAIKCVEYILGELALSDYAHVMDTARALALSYHQDSPEHIQQRVGPLLGQ
jgi:hypothetical protein